MSNLQALLKPFKEKWQKTHQHPATQRLLRLALLREILLAVHAEKSRRLVRHQIKSARLLEALERRIENQKAHPLLEKDLMRTLKTDQTSLKIRRRLPQGLTFPHQKKPFHRKDRQWEKAIAAEALFRKWHLYQVDATVKIQDAEAWHHRLEQKIWPHGIILFTEKSECSETSCMVLETEKTTPPDLQSHLQANLQAHLWSGTWYVVIDPLKIPDPKVLNLGFWNRIYPQPDLKSRSPHRL